jgi:hypothetical protein
MGADIHTEIPMAAQLRRSQNRDTRHPHEPRLDIQLQSQEGQMITDKDFKEATDELKAAEAYFNEATGFLVDYAIARVDLARVLIDCLTKQRASELNAILTRRGQPLELLPRKSEEAKP